MVNPEKAFNRSNIERRLRALKDKLEEASVAVNRSTMIDDLFINRYGKVNSHVTQALLHLNSALEWIKK